MRTVTRARGPRLARRGCHRLLRGDPRARTGAVLDRGGADPAAKRAEIAELEQQVAAPDLWDDQDNAQRVTSRLSRLQSDSTGFRASAPVSTTSRSWSSSARRRTTPPAWPRRSPSWPRCAGHRGARGAHPALRRVRRARRPGDHPLRGRRHRRGRLRRDAAADVPALGRAAQLRHRGLRHLLRRGGGDQVGDLRRCGRRTRTARCRSSRARTGWSGSRRSTTRAGARRRSPGVEVLPVTEETDHIDIPEADLRDRRLPLLRPGRAEREHHRLGGPHHPPARPASSSPARTRSRSCRTRRRRSGCCSRGCWRRPGTTARRR